MEEERSTKEMEKDGQEVERGLAYKFMRPMRERGDGLMIISSATERCIQVRSKNVNTTLQLGIMGDVGKMCFSTTGLEAGAEEGMIIE